MSLDIKIPPKVSKYKSGTIKEALRNAPPPRSLERYGDGDIVFSFGETKKVIRMETSPQVARNNYFSFKQKIMAKINEKRKERWNAYEARKLIYDQEILEEEDLIDLEEDLALTDSEEEDGDDKKEENGEKKAKEKKTTSDKNGDIELNDDKESQDVEESEDDEDDGDEDEDENEEESSNDIDMEDQSSNQSAQKEETIVSRKNKPTQENGIEINEQSVASSLGDEETDMIFNRKRKPRIIDDEDESNDSISVLSESDSNSNMKSKSKKKQQKKSSNLDLDDEVSMDDIISAIGGEKTKNQKRTENDLSDIEEDYDAENEEDEDEEEEEEEADDEVDSDDEVKEIEKEEKRSRNVFVSDEARDAYDDEEEDEEPNEEDAAMINDEDEDEEEEEEEEEDDDDNKENKNGEEDEEEEKEVRPIDFFFNEAEVSGTDSSDDEDGEDEIVRELIDEEADKLDAEKIRKDVAQTYHKELANEDKRMLLQLQERYLEDGDLHSDHKRAKKFRWGTASSTWLDNARNSDSSSNEEDDDDDDDDENVPVFRLRNTSLPLSSTENKMPDLSFNSETTLSKLPSSTLTKPSSSITSYLVRDKQLNNILSTKRSDPFGKYRGMGIKKLKPGSSETKSLFDLYK